jgi:acyl-CoA thioesterase FadM
MNMEGVGMIMADVAITFRKELFYGDTVRVAVAAGEFTRAGFTLFYRLEKELGTGPTIAAEARTGMICYDYSKKKIASLPEAARKRLSS